MRLEQLTARTNWRCLNLWAIAFVTCKIDLKRPNRFFGVCFRWSDEMFGFWL